MEETAVVRDLSDDNVTQLNLLSYYALGPSLTRLQTTWIYHRVQNKWRCLFFSEADIRLVALDLFSRKKEAGVP